MIPENAVRKAIKSPSGVFRFAVEEALTYTRGWYPFDHDWDLLIVLDACRYDLATDGPASNAFGPPEKIWSVGANSIKWIERTFRAASEDSLRQTGYISGNPFTDRAPTEKLAYVDNVLKYGFDEELGTVPPRTITDRAITATRNDVADRYIVHYMQPHLPSVEKDTRFTEFFSSSGDTDNNPWEDVEDGHLDAEEVLSEYRCNLKTAVDEVSLLLENVDAENAVITADHGNYLGEHGRWGHRFFRGYHSAVREVPLWKPTAIDKRTHTPSNYDTEAESSDQRERLEALGYL